MGTPQRDGWMRRFLGEEAEAQTRILATLRGRLERGMAAADATDPDATEPPSREWVRAARLYLDGYRALATLELETAKLRLLATRVTGKAPMSDEEYQAQLEALGRDGLDALPVDELEIALARRRALASSSEP